ncbi:hypothetical protein D3C87_1774500 [compost metagenome]
MFETVVAITRRKATQVLLDQRLNGLRFESADNGKYKVRRVGEAVFVDFKCPVEAHLVDTFGFQRLTFRIVARQYRIQ